MSNSKANQIREILNKNMGETLWNRQEIYEMVRLSQEGKSGENALFNSPGRLSLPPDWRNSVHALLRFEVDKGTISFDGIHYTKEKHIPLR